MPISTILHIIVRCVKFADQFQTPTQSPSKLNTSTIGYDAHKQKLKPAVEAFFFNITKSNFSTIYLARKMKRKMRERTTYSNLINSVPLVSKYKLNPLRILKFSKLSMTTMK